jgi:2'-5' RNA ligase
MAAGGAVQPALNSVKQRVFYALWPDARVRADLAQAARRMHQLTQGNCVREDNIHLTLAFIGAVSMENMACLMTPPARVLTSPFLLTVDHWGCWTDKGIGWAAPSHVPTALRNLAANLSDWLHGAGLQVEQRPFTPHVTLVRHAHGVRLPNPIARIEWQVEEIVLIGSSLMRGGARYEKLGNWALM